MKFVKLFFWVLIPIILSGCVDQKPINDDKIYDVINDLIADSIVQADLVINYVNIIHDQSELYNDTAKVGYPQPPIPGVIYFGRNDFVNYYNEGLILEKDIDFMYNQIGNKHKFILNPQKINRKTISDQKLSSINDSCKYHANCFDKYIFENFGARSLVSFTDAIYSVNLDKCIIGFSTYDQKGSQTKIYILGFYDNSWQIVKLLKTQ